MKAGNPHAASTPSTPRGASWWWTEAVVAADVAVRSELRWLVDPDDYLRPMSYDPDDPRWSVPGRRHRVGQFCH
jgi:hypothetical protein